MIDTRGGEITPEKDATLRSIPIAVRNEIEQAGAKFSLERINAAHIESVGSLEEEGLSLRVFNSFLEDFAVTRVRLSSAQRLCLHWPKEAAAVKIVLLVDGQINLSVGEHAVAIDRERLNMVYSNNATTEIYSISGDIDFVIIKLSKAFIKTLIPQTEHDLFEKEPHFKSFFKSGYKLTLKISELISQVLDYKCPEYLKRIHLQSKITELFFQLMLNYTAERESSQELPIHVEKQMYEAKKQILENIKNPHTLKTLARIIGTNEYELKRNFKQLFGITVFGYINDIRMQRAQKYLKNTQLTIAQIADKIGYKNPQHFSTAFKKSIGSTPSAYRFENSK